MSLPLPPLSGSDEDSTAGLEYPREWTFTLFGKDRSRLLDAARQVLGPEPFHSEDSRTSRGGRYLSLHVHTRVESESVRNALFMALRSHEDVAMVL